MNNLNYDKLMMQTIKGLKGKPRLLLHSCCAPCSTACIERLMLFFDITVYYYNPNLDSLEEFYKRSIEQERLCKEMKVNCIIENYNREEFYSMVKGYEHLLEGGERCFRCYELRLDKTAVKGVELGFDYFATTLTLSPLKSAEKLNQLGLKLEEKRGIKYLPSDFKKRGGFKRSIELSREYNLYRQSYCGCEFSKGNLPTGK